ncbi:MAG: hypothetical protein OEV94_00825 [Deltaproteobacteria bacterium]|nr:hypothetical protein [Deltaproteobacteria bacterium]
MDEESAPILTTPHAWRRYDSPGGGSILFYPVLPGRMESAAWVRQELLARPPVRVAVELPGPWMDTLQKGVARLPMLGLILAPEGEAHLFHPLEPTDPFLEALRTARELGIPAEAIDLDVEGLDRLAQRRPDPYPVFRLGPEDVLPPLCDPALYSAHPEDDRRETMMAHALQRMLETWKEPAGQENRGGSNQKEDGRDIACVIHPARLRGLLAKLATPQPRPLAPARPRRLRLFGWSDKSLAEFMTEPPFVAAAYERWRKAVLGKPIPETNTLDKSNPPVDRLGETQALLEQAAEGYRKRSGMAVTPAQFRQLGTFARRYAQVDGLLVPDLYQITVAARGVAGDDLARDLWELGTLWPWPEADPRVARVNLDDHAVNVRGRTLRLTQPIRRAHPTLSGLITRQRRREKNPGEWKQTWEGEGICSFPPEDIVIEEAGRRLKTQAKTILSARHGRVEPFRDSLKDGLDLRETLRRWPDGQRLFVKEEQARPADVGSVVVIFDEDAQDQERYPWRVTWLGEHEQESDMALYATPAGEDLAGPGISRCEYGGLMLSSPPRRMMDVWGDPYYSPARTKAERLLMAALDYSVERAVAYVAAHPPRPWFHLLAARMGRKLLYIPIGQIPAATLKKIRVFHVLDGKPVREYAGEYI